MIVNALLLGAGAGEQDPGQVERGPRRRLQADAVPVQEKRGLEAGREAGGPVQVMGAAPGGAETISGYFNSSNVLFRIGYFRQSL